MATPSPILDLAHGGVVTRSVVWDGCTVLILEDRFQLLLRHNKTRGATYISSKLIAIDLNFNGFGEHKNAAFDWRIRRYMFTGGLSGQVGLYILVLQGDWLAMGICI